MRQHECERCGERFYFLDSLNRHMRKHEIPAKKLRRVGSYKGHRITKRTARDEVERHLVCLERDHLAEDRRCAALYCAVLRKAWEDAWYGVRPMSGHSTGKVQTIISEARHFLTGNYGWETRRIEVCDYADIDHDWLKKKARDKLGELKQGGKK